MSIKKRCFRNICKIFFGISSALVSFELALKIIENSSLWRVFPVVEPILGEPDSKVGFKFTPKAKGIWLKENRTKVEINTIGIRDQDLKKIPSEHYKIVLTGDSMVEAFQVNQENNFENITEENLLKEKFNVQIFNLAKSGDGPLRQLINLEEMGYPIKPDLGIIFSGLDEFFSGELIDDSLSPAYKLNNLNEYERSYSFRNRWQVKYSNNKYFRFLLDKLQNYSIARVFYFRLKNYINPLKLESRKINNNNINESEKCYEKKIDLYLSILKYDSLNKPNKLLITFLNDIEKSLQFQKLTMVYFDNSIPIPNKKCKKAIIKRQELVKNLVQIFNEYNIDFVDFKYEIYKENNFETIEDSFIKFDQGHLNYNGHYLYSKALTRLIKDIIKQ